jgi:hypothetical protein
VQVSAGFDLAEAALHTSESPIAGKPIPAPLPRPS